MNVVDPCGWLEYFAGGEQAEFFAPALCDTKRRVVPTICLLEVFERVAQQRDVGQALPAVSLMRAGIVAELTADRRWRPRRLGIMHKRPLADAVVLATARYHGAEAWTLDAGFAGLPGVHYRQKTRAKRRQGPRDARPRKAVREQPMEALNVGIQDAACGISHGNQRAADRPAGLKGTRGIHREASSGTAVSGGWVDASDSPCYWKRLRALLFTRQNMFVVDKGRTSRGGRGDVMARC
ncbi:type II toxin-antitoxin system VapC family toxin [Acidiferrobacter sp. SPIII_3]|uniref:type II toxin-antitoxin system VapC family toxin n=1 Tax=Acidiferrobacter sp. SPIII_3 TaxID=1281578 RepID=UPI000D73E4D3|nr:type II toxin-antitoxin system VapC family toxin [Acidiferrobacter sp. SPIII_3]